MPNYEPEVVPLSSVIRDNSPSSRLLDALRSYIGRELRRIAVSSFSTDDILLKELHVEPAKPRDGMIILADGTDFNPGSGAGFYGRKAGVWVLLG